MYDYGARYYDPRISMFYGVDPMADKYPNISPFAYCFNNPLRFIDPTGMEGEEPKKSNNTGEPTQIPEVVVTAPRNNSPEPIVGGIKNSGNSQIKSISSGGLPKNSQSTDPNQLDPSTVEQNIPLIGGRSTYAGGNNPLTYNKDDSYEYIPTMLTDYPAIGHDRRYNNLKTGGLKGLLFDTRAIGADWVFVGEELSIALNPYIDPVTRINAGLLGAGLGAMAVPKSLFNLAQPNALVETIIWFNISNNGVTNTPGN